MEPDLKRTYYRPNADGLSSGSVECNTGINILKGSESKPIRMAADLWMRPLITPSTVGQDSEFA